jgi:RNA-binding protein 23/39
VSTADLRTTWRRLIRSRYIDPDQAKEALEKMNGFDLAGRPIRVGLGNDRLAGEAAQMPNQQKPAFQGSAFSGAGGRGAHAGGSANFDRAGGRDTDSKNVAGASALDDTDVAGVNFNNYSREALMRKLARTDEPAQTNGAARTAAKPKVQPKAPIPTTQASRCIVLRNMFDPNE